jgi:hypothetical protein
MICGHERELTRPKQRYCGRSCQQEAYRRRQNERLARAERNVKALEGKLALLARPG